MSCSDLATWQGTRIAASATADRWHALFNTLRSRQNGRLFPDGIFKWIFLNENVWISINISLKFVPKGPINNIPVLVQIMAWRRPGNKPLSEPMMVRLTTHLYITRPQWVKDLLQDTKFHLIIWLNNFKKISVIMIMLLSHYKALITFLITLSPFMIICHHQRVILWLSDINMIIHM